VVLAPGNPDYTALVRARGIAVVAPERAWSFPALLRCRAENAGRGVGLVHAHGYKADYAGLLLAPGRVGRRRAPLVITSHGLVRAGAVVRAKTWLDVRTFGRADRMIATSRPEAERLAAKCGGRIAYVPNGVRLEPGVAPTRAGRLAVRRELGLPPKARLVGFVGRLAAEKGPGDFLDACALIAAQSDDARFVVVGDGPEREKLERRLARVELHGRVLLVGARPDVPRLLAATDVLLSPSHSEGTPRVVIEAMAYGAVVVATAVGGVPDLVADGVDGLLVAPRRPDALAAATLGILQDDARAEPLRARARERAHADFGVERMARRVQDVYDEALAAHVR
jgi:glycosyltransferase involved in cell wall biosynthesis